MNWAVPVFFMITGELLLDEKRTITYSVCIKKYAKRIILALIVFGIPFSMMEVFMTTRTLNFDLWWKGVVNVIEGKSWGHLWYLYALIGIYLVLPFVKAAINHMERSQVRALLIVLFVFNFILPLIEDLLELEFGFYIPISSFALFYLIAGKYVSDYWKEVNRRITVAGCIALIALACVLIAIVDDFSGVVGYSSPIIAALALLMFLTFKGITVNEKWNDTLWKIDRLCFGVYIIHPLFINFVYKFLNITPVSFDLYWLAVPAFWIFFVCCSFAASWAMSKIKPLKKYVL